MQFIRFASCARTCISTEQELLERIQTIQTSRTRTTSAFLTVCQTKKFSPLELTTRIRLTLSDLDITIACCPRSQGRFSLVSRNRQCQIHRLADSGFEVYDNVYRLRLIGIYFTQSQTSQVEMVGKSLIHVGQVDSSRGKGPIIEMRSNEFYGLTSVDGAGGKRELFTTFSTLIDAFYCLFI